MKWTRADWFTVLYLILGLGVWIVIALWFGWLWLGMGR